MTGHGIHIPITDAAATDEPLLADLAISRADDYCHEHGLTLTSGPAWHVAMPIEVDGRRLTMRLDDGTEVETPPHLVVSFTAQPREAL